MPAGNLGLEIVAIHPVSEASRRRQQHRMIRRHGRPCAWFDAPERENAASEEAALDFVG
jgi:hypothetical protein